MQKYANRDVKQKYCYIVMKHCYIIMEQERFICYLIVDMLKLGYEAQLMTHSHGLIMFCSVSPIHHTLLVDS